MMTTPASIAAAIARRYFLVVAPDSFDGARAAVRLGLADRGLRPLDENRLAAIVANAHTDTHAHEEANR